MQLCCGCFGKGLGWAGLGAPLPAQLPAGALPGSSGSVRLGKVNNLTPPGVSHTAWNHHTLVCDCCAGIWRQIEEQLRYLGKGVWLQADAFHVCFLNSEWTSWWRGKKKKTVIPLVVLCFFLIFFYTSLFCGLLSLSIRGSEGARVGNGSTLVAVVRLV